MSFNSSEFAWKDIKINLGGNTITKFKEVKYKKSKEKELLYGGGDEPLGIQHGNKSVEGQVTLYQSALEKLNAAVKAIDPNSDALDYNYDLVITYGSGGGLVTDIVLDLSFTEYEKGMEQNDKQMEIAMPFIARAIRENV